MTDVCKLPQTRLRKLLTTKTIQTWLALSLDKNSTLIKKNKQLKFPQIGRAHV